MPDDPGTEGAPIAPSTQAAPPPPATADDEPSGTAGQVAESAAEIALGAVIAPFTGGETVTMVETIKETVEEGVERLTHLGHHEAESAGDDDTDHDGSSPPPSIYSPDTSIDVPADDGRE
jgi:hypothetical protein